MKTYTLFYDDGTTQLIQGKDFENALESIRLVYCPANATWKGGDCTKDYYFKQGR